MEARGLRPPNTSVLTRRGETLLLYAAPGRERECACKERFDDRRTRLQYFRASATKTLCVASRFLETKERVTVLWGATILPSLGFRKPMARTIALGRLRAAPQFAVVDAKTFYATPSLLPSLVRERGVRGARLRVQRKA